MIGRSVVSQSKEHFHENFPGGFAVFLTFKFFLNPMPSFHEPYVLHISG